MSASIELELITETEPVQTQEDMTFVEPGTIKAVMMYEGKVYGTLWLSAEEAELLGEGLLRKVQESRKLTDGKP